MDKIEKKIEDIRMLVIPTARKYEYKQNKYLKDYIGLGFKEENICRFVKHMRHPLMLKGFIAILLFFFC